MLPIIILVGFPPAASVPAASADDAAPTGDDAPAYEAPLRQICRQVRSAALIDVGTGQPLFRYRADEVLPPASTVKLMLLLLAAEEIESGRRSPTDSIVVSRRSFETGGQQLYLAAGETYTLETLALATAVHSANDAAVALAEGLFGSYERTVTLMNTRAADLSLSSMRFVTPHGLPPSWGQHGDRASAWDLARLGREAARRPVLLKWTSTRRTVFPGRDLTLINSNVLLGKVPGVDGLKTGVTGEAKYCLVVTAERDGRRLVCAILGAETSRARFAVARRLLDYGFGEFEPRTVVAAGAPVGVRVAAGRRGGAGLPILAGQSVLVWQHAGDTSRPTVRLAVADTLDAGATPGSTVGEVLVYRDTVLLGRVPAVVGDPDEIDRVAGAEIDRTGR